MKAFVSWSGGKDCMFALHSFLRKNDQNKVHTLLNMCNESGTYSGSHGLQSALIKIQADNMNLPLIQHPTSHKDYESNFKSAITNLKKEGVDSGIFGDIYLEAHREWITRVCGEMEIHPVFPLWGIDTKQLLKDFIKSEFKAIVVAVKNETLSEEWLGRILDSNFYDDIILLNNIDACAEKGEYHTYVYDGPLFDKHVKFKTGLITKKDESSFLEITA